MKPKARLDQIGDYVLLQGILLSVILNSLLCTLLLLLYIPYSLNWSPIRKQIEDQKNGSLLEYKYLFIELLAFIGEMPDALDFDWKIFDSSLVIIILFLLLTDLFLIVGVRKPHK